MTLASLKKIIDLLCEEGCGDVPIEITSFTGEMSFFSKTKEDWFPIAYLHLGTDETFGGFAITEPLSTGSLFNQSDRARFCAFLRENL